MNDLLAVSYTDQRRLDQKTKELVFIYQAWAKRFPVRLVEPEP